MESANTRRLDPEYFQKAHLRDEQVIASRSALFGTSETMGISVDASAFYPSIEDFYDTGELPFYRVGDIDGIIDEQRALSIPEELCSRFPTLKKVRPGDIVFTKGGAIDRAGLVKKAGAVSRDLIFLNTSRLPEGEQLTLFAYFRSNLFRRLLTRSSSQTAQPHLTITLVRDLPLFSGSKTIKSAVARTTSAAYQCLDTANERFLEAEQRLTTSLGLANWAPPEPLAYVASSTHAFASGRLDAQFFAPRIQQLIDHLFGTGTTVGMVAAPRREKFDAAKHGNFDYIEIGNLDGTGATGSSRVAADEAPSRATWFVRPGDIITSTVRPIRRLSAQIAPDQNGFVCSSGFVVLDPTGVQPELLLTYLRLPVICELMDLFASASMYPAISEADILALPFPTVDEATERAMVDAVQEGRAARAQARVLLTAAKRAVEIAIEDSEAAALAYLEGMGGL